MESYRKGSILEVSTAPTTPFVVVDGDEKAYVEGFFADPTVLVTEVVRIKRDDIRCVKRACAIVFRVNEVDGEGRRV